MTIHTADNRTFTLRPASEPEAGLFFAQTPEQDRAMGIIGHIRMDFGRSGKEFWHTWHPRGPLEWNTPVFSDELNSLVDELRKNGPLKDMESMRRYCREHGGAISGGWVQNYGYVAESECYRYYVDFAATSPTARGKKSTFTGKEVHLHGERSPLSRA